MSTHGLAVLQGRVFRWSSKQELTAFRAKVAGKFLPRHNVKVFTWLTPYWQRYILD
jgi:hypothetical protein